MTADLSDNAIRMWLAYFMGAKSTLRFGGDHAGMEITPEARAALNELIEVGAVKAVAPDDQWPGREHYGSTDTDLREELRKRPHLNPFKDPDEFITFRKKVRDGQHE